MPAHFEIPGFLSHLPVDERGYPIPYFVAIVKGEPDFRLLDAAKQKICVDYNKCAVCGKRLVKGLYYFVSGPIGVNNRISTDPPMHRECAEFSIEACPHLHFEKSRRRDKDIIQHADPHGAQLLDKPEVFIIAQADNYRFSKKNPGGIPLIEYKLKKIFAAYTYQDGTLKKVV